MLDARYSNLMFEYLLVVLCILINKEYMADMFLLFSINNKRLLMTNLFR